MDTIYRNARTVVTALDDICVGEDEADFLKWYLDQYCYSDLPINQQPNRGLNPPFMQRHPLFRSLFERILSSIWFERAWCAHEMRMGRCHTFLIPCASDEDDDSFTFIRFTGAFFLHMLLLASELNTRHDTRLRTLLEFFALRAIQDEREVIVARSPSAKFPPIPASPSFIPLIAEVFKQSTGGNPRLPSHLRRLDANRDRISIALSSAGLPLVLKPTSPLQRPSIEDECLRQLLLVGIAARDPVALCTTGTPLQLHDGSISWLSRPTALDLHSRYHGLPRFPKSENPITQGSDGRAEYVQLDLVFLDLPHRNQPNHYFQTHIQRARAIIELSIQCRLPCSEPMWASWQEIGCERASGMQNIFSQTLACCFECGPQWLIDVSTSLQSASKQRLTPQMVDTLCNPQLIIQNYIRTVEGHQAFTLLLEFLAVLIARGIPWASGATELTHGPLITSLPQAATPSLSPSSSPVYNHSASSSASSIPYIAPQQHHYSPSQVYSPSHPTSQNTTSKALLFAPFAHSKTLLVSVPDAVKSSQYSELARAWILVPTSGFTSSPKQVVSWMLHGKAVLFGEGGFGTGLEGVSEKRWHRVFGASS